MTCKHESFQAVVDVHRLVEDEKAADVVLTGLMADVRIVCLGCGGVARFRCPTVGLVHDRPAISVMAEEIHLPIYFKDEELGLQLPGYTVKGDFDPDRRN